MGGLRGNRGNPAGKGTTPREKDNQQEWGVGEVLQGTGGTQREQVGLAGKELRMLEGTPEQTAWETSGQQSALNTCLH